MPTTTMPPRWESLWPHAPELRPSGIDEVCKEHQRDVNFGHAIKWLIRRRAIETHRQHESSRRHNPAHLTIGLMMKPTDDAEEADIQMEHLIFDRCRLELGLP